MEKVKICHFLTMSKVKTRHILVKRKNGSPNFSCDVKYMTMHQNSDKMMKKWGKGDFTNYCLGPKTEIDY